MERRTRLHVDAVSRRNAFETPPFADDDAVRQRLRKAVVAVRETSFEARRADRLHRDAQVDEPTVFRRVKNFDRKGTGAVDFGGDVEKIALVNGRVAGGNLFERDRLRTFDRRRRRDDPTDRRERTFRRKNGINGANGDDDRERDAPTNQPGTVDERFRRRRRGPIRRLERDAAQNRRIDGVKVGEIV